MNALKDQLLGALVGLSRASESKEISESAGKTLVEGLILAHNLEATSDLANETDILAMIDCLHEAKNQMAPDCAACQYPCGRIFDYEMEEIYSASEPLRDAKLLLLHRLGQIAAYPSVSQKQEIRQFLSDALFQISCTYTAEQLAEPLAKAEAILQNDH